MENVKRQAMVVALLEAMKERGSWCGETHVQKCAYFLQEALEVPLGLSFVLYKHGPFSFELRDLLGDMRARLLIDVQPLPPSGPSLEATESGRRLKVRFRQTIGTYADQVDFVATRLSTRGVAELERLGTALYVTRENGLATPARRAQRIVELKPHVSEELAEAAVRQVDDLLADARTLNSA